MNTIKRAVIAQGIFFSKNKQKKNNKHTILHPHISHPSLKPHQQQKEKKDKRQIHKDKTGHYKRGQDKTRHPSVQLTCFPIHTKDTKTGIIRGNITVSNMHMWNPDHVLVSGCDLACQQEVSLALTKTPPIHYYNVVDSAFSNYAGQLRI